MENRRPYPSIPQAVGLLLLVLILQVILVLPAAVLDLGFEIRILDQTFVLGLANLIAFGLVLWIGVHKARAPLGEIFPLSPVAPRVIFGVLIASFGLAVAGSQLVALIDRYLPSGDFLSELQKITDPRVSLSGTIFTIVLVAPLTEELFFRGLVLGGLLRRYSATVGILVSAVMFAVLHLNPWQAVPAIAAGVFLGWVFHKTGSLVPCLVGHLANNALAVAAVAAMPKLQDLPKAEFSPPGFATGVVLTGIGVQLLRRYFRGLGAEIAR
ncbi:MAG: CPBP family intramembrane metalloprotease [Bryobacteraceae bacterium]|nr:CPBP family intramembrane metalloprotease [Bryobacteraceae bacterium]